MLKHFLARHVMPIQINIRLTLRIQTKESTVTVYIQVYKIMSGGKGKPYNMYVRIVHSF